MSFSQHQENNNFVSGGGISNTAAGLDVFGNNNAVKRNKGIISRMKRSLSTSGRPPQPLPLKLPSSLLQTSSSPEWDTMPTTPYSPTPTTARSPSFPSVEQQQRSFSPIPSNLSSPTPKSSSGNSYFGASPTTHLSYETFASSSASNLSIRSFPASAAGGGGDNNLNARRSSDSNSVATNVTNNGKRTIPNSHSLSYISSTSSTSNNEKLQVKSMFESRLIENEKVSMTKLVPTTPTETKKKRSNHSRSFYGEDEQEEEEDLGQLAPAPAMYWSCPDYIGKIKPPPLRAHSSVVFGDKMYVYGGTSKSACSDTLYVLELDTSNWTIPHVYGTLPPACRAHSLSVDEPSGKIYLFGGGDGQKYYNHLYILDTYTMIWSRPKTSGTKPSERRAHVAVVWKKALYVFGGGDGTRALNDTHRLNLKTKEWELINAKGNKPTRRGYHTGTLVANKLIVFGGSDGKECFGGIHVLDLETETWYNVDHIEPQIPRLSHSAICIGSFLFVIAGHDGNKYRNDLLMLNLVNMQWETRSLYGQAPTARGYHSTVLYDSRIYLFGGFNGSSFSNQTYILDLSSYAYLPQIVNFTIDL